MAKLSFLYDKIVETILPTPASTLQPSESKLKIVELERDFLLKKLDVNCIGFVDELGIAFEKVSSRCTSIVQLEFRYKGTVLQVIDKSSDLQMLNSDKCTVLCHILTE